MILLLSSVTMLGVLATNNIIIFIVMNIIFFALNAIIIPVTQDLVASRSNDTNSSIVMGFYNAIKSLGGIIEREGAIKGKNELLVGGWCEVYRSDKKFPIKSSVSMEEYDKKQSSWKTMPMVMIRKCAMVTALREAFPEELQGLYDADEIKDLPDSDSLPQKEVRVGYATAGQKQGIMKMADRKSVV